MTKKELLKELKKYKKLSIHDPLTGLYNRRKLNLDLEQHYALQTRYNINPFVIMLDIDKFKLINDSKGHKAGDKVLKKITQILKETIRKVDRIYRIGGDEFIIILSPCDNNYTILKRLLDNLEKININVSIGCEELCKNILDVIDKRMYEDKGGNQNVTRY